MVGCFSVSAWVRLILVSCLAVFVLVGCGGGGGGDEPIVNPAVNVAPVAVAGPSQNVVALTLVTLNGSASSDPDGNALTYRWTLTTRPAGSAATLGGADTVSPTFTADLAGTYVATLVVNDGALNSAPSTVTIMAAVLNAAPNASAGPAQNVVAGALVTLDGSASQDPNGDPITYSWTLTGKPAGSVATLGGANTAAPTFTADKAGNYVATLVVSDGALSGTPATVAITAAVQNSAPNANAGAAQNVVVGSVVTLNGSASQDPNGDPITYSWTLTSKPAGSAAGLSGTNTAAPTFTADKAGAYVATLVVSDGTLNSAAATVTITAAVLNSAPNANAGPAQNVVTGALVTLNGGASLDPNGDPITYAWTLTSKPTGSSATVSGANTAAPTFTADKAGTYVATLVVNDGALNSTPATVTITSAVLNSPPNANAGTGQNVFAGSLVTLNGGASLDPNGDSITYAWILTSKPGGSSAALAGANTAAPTFTADKAGTYVATLVVNDGVLNSNPATVTITAAVLNSAPNANAGTAQSVVTGAVVALNGSASLDPNGDPITYGWTLTSKPSGSTAILNGADTATPTFTADKAGTYVATLVVSDGVLSSAPATVTITAAVLNAAPNANAGTAQNVVAGLVVTLNGSASADPNGDPITYSWTLTSKPAGSAATLNGANTAAPTFTADKAGTYVATLVVSDGALSSAPATVTITAAVLNAAPNASAGAAQSVVAGSLVTLDGSASADPNGDPITYSWTLTSKPSGSSATLVSSNTATPTFTADKVGTYVATLVVSDGALSSSPVSVTITATMGSVAGTWSGTTGQGRAISFDVDSSGIPKLTLSFSAPGCGVSGTSTITITPSIAVVGASFNYSSSSGFLRSFTGSFSSSTAASGLLTFRHEDYNFFCFQTINTSWTASKP